MAAALQIVERGEVTISREKAEQLRKIVACGKQLAEVMTEYRDEIVGICGAGAKDFAIDALFGPMTADELLAKAVVVVE